LLFSRTNGSDHVVHQEIATKAAGEGGVMTVNLIEYELFVFVKVGREGLTRQAASYSFLQIL
jgi:hypothetical protein